VTEEVPGARTLGAALRDARDPAHPALLARAAGRAVGALHAAGVEHADLNVDNLLVVWRPDGAHAWVIDLDRAHVHPGPLAPAVGRRSLRRLARSWRKTTGAEAPRDLRAAFGGGYAETGGRACAS
jgi:3-deoxy-D-manno-octulosonic acid kinase